MAGRLRPNWTRNKVQSDAVWRACPQSRVLARDPGVPGGSWSRPTTSSAPRAGSRVAPAPAPSCAPRAHATPRPSPGPGRRRRPARRPPGGHRRRCRAGHAGAPVAHRRGAGARRRRLAHDRPAGAGLPPRRRRLRPPSARGAAQLPRPPRRAAGGARAPPARQHRRRHRRRPARRRPPARAGGRGRAPAGGYRALGPRQPAGLVLRDPAPRARRDGPLLRHAARARDPRGRAPPGRRGGRGAPPDGPLGAAQRGDHSRC